MKTTEFELSKRFDELGLRKKTYLYWVVDPSGEEPILCSYYDDFPEPSLMPACVLGKKDGEYFLSTARVPYESINEAVKIKKKYRVYTLNEILEMLPASITKEDYTGYLVLTFSEQDNEFPRMYTCEFDSLTGASHKNPAEAAGLLLEWCIKEGYVKVDELNDCVTNE